MTEQRPRTDVVRRPVVRMRRVAAVTAVAAAAVLLAGCGPVGDAAGVAEEAPATTSATTGGAAADAPSNQEEPGSGSVGVLRVEVGATVRTTLTEAIRALTVADERRTGYARDLFAHWVDADRNGCDTRQEVLVTQNRAPGAQLTDDCAVLAGEWYSYYDQVTTTSASDFDVDHLVPLAEAWDSGARSWSPQRREAFANDLGDRRALIAVSRVANQRKSDGDPSEWMPAQRSCVYVSSWVAVKLRWQLSIDAGEKDTLLRYAVACGSRRTTVRVAHVTRAGSTSDARPSDAAGLPRAVRPASGPTPVPVPTAPAGGTGGSGNGGIDPRFDYCTTAIASGFGPYRRGADPEYDWYRDNDSDGVVCES